MVRKSVNFGLAVDVKGKDGNSTLMVPNMKGANAMTFTQYLAAFDDIPWFVHTDPPITAVAQPTGELGRAAVRALVDRIEGRPPQSVTLPARLVVRLSCGEEHAQNRSTS